MKHTTEEVICAAIWFQDGIRRQHMPTNIKDGLVVTGYRHCQCYSIVAALSPKFRSGFTEIQGFLTSYGLFVNRNQAAEIARKAGQISSHNGELFSEDLY